MKKKGFTIIELLAIILILGIISIIAIPIFSGIIKEVKVSSKKITAEKIVRAYEEYMISSDILQKNKFSNLSYYNSNELKDILSLKGKIPNKFETLKFDENGNVLLYFVEDGVACWNYGSNKNQPDDTNYDLIDMTCQETEENNTTLVDYIRVKDGNFYNTTKQEAFQIIGINFDNQTWNTQISTGNTGHDETSYAEIKAMGFNTIRFGLAFNMTLADDFFEWLDTNINQAEAAGLKIELDMHASQGGIQIREKDATYQFWQSDDLKQQFIDTWVAIASHYKNNNTVILYDLLNEPLVIINEGQDSISLYYELMSDLVEAIRKVDKKTTICIESYNSVVLSNSSSIDEKTYSTAPSDLTYLINNIVDDNIVYDMHTYSPTQYTFQTEEEILYYDDVFEVSNYTWDSNGYYPSSPNTNYFIVNSNKIGEWFETETGLHQLMQGSEPATSNYANVQYILEKEEVGVYVCFDNIIIEEYDNNKNYVGIAYSTNFDKKNYHLSIGNNYTASITDSGYDSNGGSLCIVSTSATSQGAVQIQDVGFVPTPGYYYNIKAKVKTTADLSTSKHLRIRLLGATAGYVGGLRELADYNILKYKTFREQNNIPLICNEFGTNYNSISKAGGDQYLYEIMRNVYKYNTNIFLFSYAGKDFGLMYDSTGNFGTEQSKLRQESYDAIYKAINQNNTYQHIFKNIEYMKKYDKHQIGEKVLVLGKEKAGIGSKYEYTISTNMESNSIDLGNGLYANLTNTIK